MKTKEEKAAYEKQWKLNNKIHVKDYQQQYYKRKALQIKRYKLNKVFGLTLEQYQQLLQEQKGCCKICLRPSIKQALCVDHNHTTNRVRGLLCSSCNKALGLFQDRLDILHSASDYLRSSLC